MRPHPHAARRYTRAKCDAADLHPDSRGAYGGAKEPIVTSLVWSDDGPGLSATGSPSPSVAGSRPAPLVLTPQGAGPVTLGATPDDY
ncbi:hypothetical protein ACFQX7_10475 [Luedemannella flava]